MTDKRQIQDWLITRIAELLQKDPGKIDIREPFSNYGLSSLDAVTLSGELEEFIGRRLSPTITFDYPDILTLSDYLSENTEQKKSLSSENSLNGHPNEPIAVIGMSCRFPGANDPESFWQLLRDGVDMIKEIPADRWQKQAFYHPDPSVPGKAISYWGGFLDNVDKFDPFFFGISPIEAKHMDPQQRLLMELSYEAFDDAGQVKEKLDGSDTGVFVGISVNEYSQFQLSDPLQINSHSGTGSALSIAANRISYFFNFHGPSMAIDTACSSSLAAIRLACQSIRNDECKMAVAGGVNIILSPAHSIAFTKAGVLASDGRCKTFDADANGYVRGEGGGLIVMKRLSSAIADGDPIHALILGSAMKQDGRTNGLIAPSQEGQEALLREAYKAAGVSPGSVQYVEAHGTGTLLGDSMEAKALGDVIGADRKDGFCSIGSVKTNIGHLEAAAGIAGLIKVIQSMKHRALPPSLHYHSPNPLIPFDQLHLKVNNELRPWSPDTSPMLAGISSFGFGGTNVHMVVSEARNISQEKESNEQVNSTISRTYLLPFSAKSPEALKSTANDFLNLLAADSSIAANDLCYAAGLRRSEFDYRLSVIGNSKKELYGSLNAYLQDEDDPNIFRSNETHYRQPKLVFVFSGQGGQWYGMGRELLKTEPVFFNAVEKIDRLIQKHFSWSLMNELCAERPESRLNEIDVIQPAIFAIQVAIAELWKSWGITPDAVAGHSMGEVAAAHIAGILTLEDAVHIICSRSKLLKKLSGKGSMLATELSADQAKEIVKKYSNGIAVGVINSPCSTVLSGNPETLNKVMDSLQQQNLFCKQVNVDVASHSPQIDLLRTEMFEALKDIHPQPVRIPTYSTVTGALAHDISFDSEYWIDNLRKPVLFSDTIGQLLDNEYSVFVEIGPHPVLLSSIQQSLKSHHRNISLLPSLKRDEPEQENIFKALSALYTNGFTINWKNLNPKGGKYFHLPPIPWQRQRYWIDIRSAGPKDPWHRVQIEEHHSHPLLGERLNLANSPSSFIWQTNLDNEAISFLKDHRINKEIVFPAAGYIEMALTAAKETGLKNSHELSDFLFKERMILQNGKQRTIQTLITPDKEDNFSFSVYSLSDTDKKWTLHASVSFIKKEDHDPLTSMINSYDEIRQQGNSHFTSDEFYQKLQSLGIQYGKSFRTVQHLWNRDGESLGEVSLPDSLQYGADFYQIHPALLDGCLQVIAATQAGSSGNNLYLPIGCKHTRFFSRPGGTVWSHVSLRPDSSQGQDILNADIALSDSNGSIIAELIGFSLQRTSRHIRQLLSQQDIWMYQLQWQIKEGSTTSPVALQKGKNWLIFGHDEGVAGELAKQLELSGDLCHLLSYKDFEDDLAGKIEKCINNISSPLYGIIHLWSNAISPAIANALENPIEMSMQSCNSVVYLVQALSKRLAGMPRLWLMTKGAQQVINGEPVAAEQSTLWGLCKTISFEIPELKCIRIDLDPLQPDPGNAQLLFKEISKDDNEDQLAFRNGVRYVERLLPFTPKTVSSSTALVLRADSTYLITGGMGGLGLKTAEWMISRGAKHLVLSGRNKPSLSTLNVIDQMRKQGVEVVVAEADVSDPGQLKKVFDNLNKEMPPLRGVIHAAGVLDDTSLLNLNVERMKKVMAPKVNGTWNLHNATMKLPLDFFVLFSSAVSVLGSPGQANYAAASSYLDAMAHLRHNMGLPAISINWGPWAEVGLAAEATEKLKEQNASTQHLIKMIKIDRGLEVLEQLLTESTPQVMVLPFDLKNLIELYPAAAGMPFLSEVGGNDTHIARLYSRPKLRQQYVAPRNELERKLAELWRQTLHIDNVGVHDSFFELGGDSVLAAQILALAQKTFGIRINPQDAFKAFTIEKLAEMLEAAIIGKIEQMSEEEAEERLSKEINMTKTNLSETKKALLQKWFGGELHDTAVTIPKHSLNSPSALSFPQQRQLFLEMLQPGTAVNNLSVLLDIKGKLDIAALEQAANEIIARHEVLRTCFSFAEGLPTPKILNEIRINIPIIDLQNIEVAEQEAKTRRLAEKEVLQFFDLSKAPLIRLNLYVLSKESYILLVTVHHTIADGWSFGVFLNELILFYQNISSGTSLLLPELPTRYADFANWQTDTKRTDSMQSSLNYWKQQLSSELPVLELPTDHPRSTKQTFTGGTHRFVLSKSLTDSLEKFCQQEDVTLFMTLLTVFDILLHRYSGQDDILIGTPVANRNLPEIKNLIGVFINTIVLRANLEGDPVFSELLNQVKDISLNAYAYQDLPFEKLVEELKPKRDLSRTPIFQVVFNLQNSPMPKMEIPDLKIVPLEIDRGVSQFDLSLMMTKSGSQYNCTVEYNSDLFTSATIKRIFDSFQLLLEHVLADPDCRISELKIVDDNYLYHIIHELNQAPLDFPREKCLHQLFEKQVRKTPDSVAVIHNSRSLTYSELNNRANQLARHLQSLGAETGNCVGILMEKTLEITEALLAVLKSGGTYVPISTSFPAERIKFILEDANVQVLLTNVGTESLTDTAVKIVNLNNDDNYLTINDCPDIPINITPDHLAYIIYTSGSTGLPKGVMVQHSALMNFICSMQTRPGIKSDDVLLSVTPISFDIAALELFLPLTVGATVIIAGKEIMANPLSIGDAIGKYNLNVMQATPAVWQLLIESGWTGKRDLKALCGGEALTRKLADQILDRTGSLWNMYGPTETTIWSAVNQIQKDNAPITIGQPIGNTQLYILDKYLQPVPFGVAGELHIGGEGLALGYLKQNDITQKKFIPDHFCATPGARLYKTGDMARYLPDYSIEIIGRTDHQVKIYGYRIELGEITSILTQHPLVNDAIVISNTESTGDKRLLAYFVSKSNQSLSANELQEFARKKLPAYMIPVVFFQLNELPLTSNGKIDRRLLPVPENIRQFEGYVAPGNEVEQILADIWQSVLEIEQIGIHDNFFDLGGASIQSLQVVAGASLSGLHLSPEMIFEHQTIAELAQQISKN